MIELTRTTTDHRGPYQVAGPAIIFKDFGEEFVVANLDSGLFYSLNGFAGYLWREMSAGRVCSDIVAPYGSAEADDIREFVATLVSERLIRPADDVRAPADPAPPRPFSTPTLERFDDLQGLLMIDPIHEVSEAGWPLTP